MTGIVSHAWAEPDTPRIFFRLENKQWDMKVSYLYSRVVSLAVKLLRLANDMQKNDWVSVGLVLRRTVFKKFNLMGNIRKYKVPLYRFWDIVQLPLRRTSAFAKPPERKNRIRDEPRSVRDSRLLLGTRWLYTGRTYACYPWVQLGALSREAWLHLRICVRVLTVPIPVPCNWAPIMFGFVNEFILAQL